MGVYTYRVCGTVYTVDGKSHQFSYVCQASFPNDAKNMAEAEVYRCYGYENVKKIALNAARI